VYPSTRECVQVSGTPILKEVMVRSDSVYKCHTSVPDRFSSSRILLLATDRRARPRSVCKIERRVRAFVLMPCKHHANYYGIQSLFFDARTRARSRLFADLMYPCANAFRAIDDIDAFSLVTRSLT